MKRRQQHDVFIVLGALIGLSFGIGLLHGDQKNYRRNNEQVSTTIKQLEPLMEARSVEKIAKSLTILPIDHIKAVVDSILKNNNAILTREDKIALICALTTEFQRQPHKATLFFELLSHYPGLIKNGQPILYVMSRLYYDPLMPHFLAWIEDNKPIGVPPAHQLLERAGDYALTQRASGAARRLFSRGLAFSAQQLNRFLWELAHRNGNPKIVPALVEAGADLQSHFFGTTPLFQAVKNNNQEMVIALIKAGADVNFMADKAYGSPLQEAIALQYTPLELILRQAGAREIGF